MSMYKPQSSLAPIYDSDPLMYSSSVYSDYTPNATSDTSSAYPGSATMEPMAFGRSGNGYDEHHSAGPYLHVGAAQMPQVTSYHPRSGYGSEPLSIYLTALYDLVTSRPPVFHVMIGQSKVRAGLKKIGQSGGVCQYEVATEVPAFARTKWSVPSVPIVLYMESADGDMLGKIDVGEYAFAETGTAAKKRKASFDYHEEQRNGVNKRQIHQVVRSAEGYLSPDYLTQQANYHSYLTPAHSPYSTNMPQQVRHYAMPHMSRMPAYPASRPSSSSSALRTSLPLINTWTTGEPAMISTVARSSVTPLSHTSASSSTTPILIRTSTIAPNASTSSSPYAPYTPYSLYSNKAKLEIKGDLESMARNWTAEEWESRRRIVHFRRSQSGSVITTEFEPLALEARRNDAVCVSCIYWAEKQACFITSVDTIYLLEQLIASRFTVEEKNRIRRNLEGFRPFTVSKGKSDSEDFFKLIMAFPNPKPRNIEKDVKVFQWKDLTSALKKILGKYSASPASTVQAMSATSYNSGGGGGDPSLSGRLYDPHEALSPRSLPGLAPGSVYGTPVRSSGGGGAGDGNELTHNAWNTTNGPNYAAINRASWDLASYLDTSPGGGEAAEHKVRPMSAPDYGPTPVYGHENEHEQQRMEEQDHAHHQQHQSHPYHQLHCQQHPSNTQPQQPQQPRT